MLAYAILGVFAALARPLGIILPAFPIFFRGSLEQLKSNDVLLSQGLKIGRSQAVHSEISADAVEKPWREG
jgi:hypothetical protein